MRSHRARGNSWAEETPTNLLNRCLVAAATLGVTASLALGCGGADSSLASGVPASDAATSDVRESADSMSAANMLPCPTAQPVACGPVCVDLNSDPNNCGACEGVCGAGQVCSMGKCGQHCAASLTRCGSACVDTLTSSMHCGGCGTTCATTQTCSDGRCGCPSGLVECGDRCVDLANDPADCGACGKTCTGATPICADGRCSSSCGSGLLVCAGVCVDLRVDSNNCGACGNKCSGGTSCVSGSCRGGGAIRDAGKAPDAHL
jgi:stigma-specific protein Stig1